MQHLEFRRIGFGDRVVVHVNRLAVLREQVVVGGGDDGEVCGVVRENGSVTQVDDVTVFRELAAE